MATKRKHLEARELNIEIKIQKYFENINIDITLNDETTASRSDFVKVIESNSQKLLCNDDSNADNDCKPPMDNAPEVLSCEPNSQQFLCNDVSSTDNYCKPPMDHAPEVLSCEKINELMKSALSSTVMVDALETIPALKKKCARFGIKGNFGYRQESHKPDRCGVYHVEQILDYDTTDYLYLVKWTGYGNEFNTWEPIDHLGCVTDMASDIRLMDKSLSGANKDAYKKMILLNSLLQEIASPDNKDAYILLKMTGISGLQYKPGNLAYLKNVLKSKSQRMRKALMADEQFRLDYCSILERTIKDLRIITSFESVEKLGEAVSRRNKFMKCLKNHEANINRIILKEEKGCATIELENYCDFDLPAEDFTYITKCKAGSPDIIISQSPRWSCKCGKYCQSITRKCCPIMNKSHRNYNNDGSLRSLKHNTIFECNSKCDCPSTCPNRVIQQGRKFKLGIFKTVDGRGWGVRALQRIPKGRFIMEYIGEMITVEEAERRLALKGTSHLIYLFELSYETGMNGKYVLDGENYGDISRFINHSCSPNMEVFVFWIEHSDKEMPRIAFFSRKDIASGEELTFDYRSETNSTSESDASGTKTECKCNSTNCRKLEF